MPITIDQCIRQIKKKIATMAEPADQRRAAQDAKMIDGITKTYVKDFPVFIARISDERFQELVTVERAKYINDKSLNNVLTKGLVTVRFVDGVRKD
jgi:hypothetical protein